MTRLMRRRRYLTSGAAGPTTFKLTGGVALPGGSVYARAGAAEYYDVSGVMQTASSGTFRVSHFLNGFSHHLFESARTNSALNSADFSQASWTVSLATLSGGQADPKGGTNAQGFIGTNAVNTLVDGTLNLVNAAVYTVTTGLNQAHAIFARPGNKSQLLVQSIDQAAGVHTSWVNVSTGTTGTKDASHLIKSWPLAGGWYRVEVGLTSAAAGTTCSTAYGWADADNSRTLTGDGATINGYLWGAQIEIDQQWVTSYVATAGAPVARVADTCTIPHGRTPAQRTLYMNTTATGRLGTSLNAFGWDIGGSFVANGMWFRISAATGLVSCSGNLENNGTAVTGNPAGAHAVGDQVEWRASADATPAVTGGQSVNAAAETTNTSGASGAYQGAYTGANYDLNVLVGAGSIAIRDFKDIPGAPSNMVACRAA